MKPAILNNDHMMFFDRAMEAQRSQLLTVMADAVSECRTAADQAAELSETGQIGSEPSAAREAAWCWKARKYRFWRM